MTENKIVELEKKIRKGNERDNKIRIELRKKIVKTRARILMIIS